MRSNFKHFHETSKTNTLVSGTENLFDKYRVCTGILKYGFKFNIH